MNAFVNFQFSDQYSWLSWSDSRRSVARSPGGGAWSWCRTWGLLRAVSWVVRVQVTWPAHGLLWHGNGGVYSGQASPADFV